MAFDALEVRVKSGRSGMPACVSLFAGRSSSRPSCRVAINGTMVATMGWKPAEKFIALIGTGEHRGLLRLKRAAKGPLAPRALKGGGLLFDLGFVERFGTEREPKEFVNAEAVDADTLQVVLPKWADEIEDQRPIKLATA